MSSTVLALGLRIPPVRWLMARRRWPRPEHLDRLSDEQFFAYLTATGFEARAQAALVEHEGMSHQAPGHSDVRGAEARGERAGTPVA